MQIARKNTQCLAARIFAGVGFAACFFAACFKEA